MEADKRVILGVWVILGKKFRPESPEHDKYYVKFSATSGWRTEDELVAMGRAVKQLPREYRGRIQGYKFNKA